MQWNLNTIINKIINKNKLILISTSRSFHSADEGETVFDDDMPKNAEFRINRADILGKLNIINPNLKKAEFDKLIIDMAGELNFPIHLEYLKYLLNSLLKTNDHYIIDYKYCNGIIMNTFFFYMMTLINQINTIEKQFIKNLIIYVFLYIKFLFL